MNNKVKLYGKIINIWKAFDEIKNREVNTQYEVEFTEYNLDGTIYRKGTEDFSAERFSTITNKWVYTWDGQNLNKGGKRRFEDQGMIKYSTFQAKEVKQLLNSKYPEAALIQLR